jgi:hypothetical protein
MTESVGNETIENTSDFCLVIGTDHALAHITRRTIMRVFYTSHVQKLSPRI